MGREEPIDVRFDGVPGMVLGGYLGGRIARLLGPEAEVRFLRPLVSGRPVRFEADETGAWAAAGDERIAEGRRAGVELDVPAAPTLAQAEAASRGFCGLRHHPYPLCFTCGTGRAEGDGMRVFAGPLGGGVVAATWTPRAAHCDERGEASLESLWSAVDCPALWGLCHVEAPGGGRRMVSGTMAVRALAPIPRDEPQVITAWKTADSGRKLGAGVAVFSAAGELRAFGWQIAVVAAHGVPIAWW